MFRNIFVFVCLWSLTLPNVLQAGVGSKAVQETLEYMARKLGREVAEEGVERLGQRMTTLAAKHGDDLVVTAFRKAGPQAGRLATAAGEGADGVVLRLLSRHGTEGAAALSRPGAMKLLTRFGDDGAEALLRHGKVGQEVIETFGESGVKALTKVTEQNGRRLAMLAKDGTLKPELLDVVRTWGDSACDFIWANKKALVVGATLTTFVASPEIFLNGTAQLTAIMADAVVRPVAEIPKVVLAEAVGSVTGLLGFITLTVISLGLWLLWNPERRRWMFRVGQRGFGLLRMSRLFRSVTAK